MATTNVVKAIHKSNQSNQHPCQVALISFQYTIPKTPSYYGNFHENIDQSMINQRLYGAFSIQIFRSCISRFMWKLQRHFGLRKQSSSSRFEVVMVFFFWESSMGFFRWWIKKPVVVIWKKKTPLVSTGCWWWSFVFVVILKWSIELKGCLVDFWRLHRIVHLFRVL